MHAIEPEALERFERAVDRLSARDADLASVVDRHGRPVYWRREPGFATLVLTILEQQVSLASARAAFEKLVSEVGMPTPEGFLALGDDTLRGMGFSRQKTRYCTGLARAIRDGVLDLVALGELDDEGTRQELMTIPGIGRWTADIYLLSALGRPDVWPVGDLALNEALKRVKGLPSRPSVEEFERLGEPWRPWRSAAAHILWHHYVSR